MRSRIQLVGLVALVVLIAGACGSQVDRGVFETVSGEAASNDATATADPGGTAPDQIASASTVPQSNDTAAGPGASPSGGSDGPIAPGAGAVAGASPTSSPAPGAATQNYASDVGVTENAIRVGNITTVGGPMPGQFEPWLLGVRVWVNEVNEQGGINGRKIEFVTCDDGMDAERNRACARDLIEKQNVFAIVGTNTPAMPSAAYINDQRVPAVGVAAIGNYTAQLPYWFGTDGMRICPRNGVDTPGAEGYCASNTVKSSNASYTFFRDQVGVSRAAVFWHNIDISKQAGLDMAHTLEATGIEVVYTAETQVAEPDYTGHVLQMRDRGVEGIWDSMEINNNIRLLQAMDRQGFLPVAKVGTVATFGEEIRKQVTGPSRNILFSLSTSRPYTDLENPAIAAFETQFERYFPNQTKHIWNVDGYRGARLFADAVSALGADLTRDGLVEWLNALENYSPGGLGVPMDYRYWGEAVFNAPQPPRSCFSVVQFEDDNFYKFGDGDAIQCVQGEWVEPRG